MSTPKTLNNTAAASIAFLLSLVGFWGTWGQGFRNGFLEHNKKRLTADEKLLPSVEVALKLVYTFIPPVDALIRRLHVFLWPAIDGAWPGLSLVAWEFSGQFTATMMIAALEGLREGNRGKLLTYTTVFGLISQTLTYGTTLPLYLGLHLLTSPTSLFPSTRSRNDAASDLLVDPTEATAWPIAFTIAYLIPTFLVIFPSPRFTSFSTCQIIMAFWELFPIPLKLVQILLVRYFSTGSNPQKAIPIASRASNRRAASLQSLRNLYAFAALVAGVTHIFTLTLSLSSQFFPSLFNPAIVAQLSPQTIFFVNSPFNKTPIKDAGEGLLHFLQWNMNVSNVAPVLWALLLYRNAFEHDGGGQGKWEGWTVCLAKTLGLYVFGGSGVATAWLMWRRDELVLGSGSGSSASASSDDTRVKKAL